MFKIILSFIFATSIAFGSGVKANGCDLSVVGDVTLSVGAKTKGVVDYKAVSPSGKNFRSILVGSTMTIDGLTLEILDIKANKRVKREARTGTVSVVIKKDGKSEKIDMPYSYDKGLLSAKAKQKNGDDISFNFEIKALLCHV